jgi:hypothetical protein
MRGIKNVTTTNLPHPSPQNGKSSKVILKSCTVKIGFRTFKLILLIENIK